MGKKNKKGKSTVGDSDSGMPRHLRREILEIVNVLLEKCSVPFGNQSTEWNDFLDVYQIVEKLRKKQTNYTIHHASRDDGMADFFKWLHSNGVNTDLVAVDKFGPSGYGLKALKNIEETDLILSISRKLMMTSETASNSVLVGWLLAKQYKVDNQNLVTFKRFISIGRSPSGPLIKEDRILQSMPNVSMALHVLCELCSPDSFWQPYLKILPETYTTTLYFSPDDIQLLKGSPVLSEILNQFRNITRQYAYFFRLFQGHTEAAKLPIKNFCYDDYRWAVSTVMTRQNQIPQMDCEDGMGTALIPLWDMCNHTNGSITTDFNDEKDCSECFAVRHFNADEQIYIFYGTRNNAEFLLHNGFVYEENENDKLAIRLGVSKNDTLYSMKVEVMARIELTNSVYYLYSDPSYPISSDLLAFLRIFSMDIDTLLTHLRGEDVARRQLNLKDFSRPVSRNNELKAWAFLETRCQILLHAYNTTVEEDTELLKKEDLSEFAASCIRLRRCEKLILENVIRYSSEKKQQLQMQMQEELSQPGAARIVSCSIVNVADNSEQSNLSETVDSHGNNGQSTDACEGIVEKIEEAKLNDVSVNDQTVNGVEVNGQTVSGVEVNGQTVDGVEVNGQTVDGVEVKVVEEEMQHGKENSCMASEDVEKLEKGTDVIFDGVEKGDEIKDLTKLSE